MHLMESNGVKTLDVSSEKRPTLNSVIIHYFCSKPLPFTSATSSHLATQSLFSHPLHRTTSYQNQSKGTINKLINPQNISADTVHSRVKPTRPTSIV